MTWAELTDETFKPVQGNVNPRTGMRAWFCPVCGECIGIYNTGSVHRERIEYRRNKCKNGHVIDWT